MALLYDAVALGMWAYSNAVFRVRVLGAERVRLEPGTILATTHRRETDVPLICPPLYFDGGLVRDRSRRMSFAARQDLFEPGFFAGFPASVPAAARRALWRLDIAPYLESLTLHPLRSAARIRLVDVVRAEPDIELSELPDEIGETLRARALELGLPEPWVAADVDRGEYADLLWRTFARAELNGDAFEPAWSRHAAAATRDFRELVDVTRRGAVLLFFPEGSPSPDGEIGPLLRGVTALVRRGRPARIQPIGIAYDPLTRGRTLAFVSFETPYASDPENVEGPLLRALRFAVPLTCGQVVASALAAGDRPTPEALDEAVETARREGRSMDPELADPNARRRRLREAIAAARTASPRTLEFLAREHRSAREL